MHPLLTLAEKIDCALFVTTLLGTKNTIQSNVRIPSLQKLENLLSLILTGNSPAFAYQTQRIKPHSSSAVKTLPQYLKLESFAMGYQRFSKNSIAGQFSTTAHPQFPSVRYAVWISMSTQPHVDIQFSQTLGLLFFGFLTLYIYVFFQGKLHVTVIVILVLRIHVN